MNELLALLLLGPLIQADLRVSVTEDVFMMDASPFGGRALQNTCERFCCRRDVPSYRAERLLYRASTWSA